MPYAYLASSIPDHQLAELHRLMNEEVRDVAVFFMDPQGIITVWNRAAEDMKGYTAQDAIGQHLALLYTEEDRARGWPEHNLGEATRHGFYKEETWRRRKDGRLFWARIALTALRDHSGQLLGYSKITFDLTDHKQLERCVKEREQIKRVLHAADAGTWTWHPEGDEIDVCQNFCELLGQPGNGSAMRLAQWMEFVHADDRPRVTDWLQRARAACPGAPPALEFRMCPTDAACRWFHVHADWYRDSDDTPFALNGVNVDVEDLKTSQEELRRAVDKLKEADARKDEFLAMLAHELRNPLAPIRAAAEVLRVLKLDEAQVQETSDVIARQAHHMTSLVDDLLDVSRVTRGLVTLERQPLDVREIVKDAVEQVNPVMHARQHRLALHLPPAGATVLGDRKRLVQVVANLLNNAVKFTQEGGNILLKTEVRGDTVLLQVSDNGIGMEPELAARVFELFTQAERTPDRSAGGLGLGLALVKSLVELQRGTVTCTSAGRGQGSTFTVCLPLLQMRHGAGEPQREANRLAAAGRPLRVLVVDDNADAARMLALLLKASGHQVTVEHEPHRALERSRAELPDVCLLDIGLPEMDGKELARRLKAQPETARAVLIAVTGYGQEHDRESALAAGFAHHFVKPVDLAGLAGVLAEISQRSGG